MIVAWYKLLRDYERDGFDVYRARWDALNAHGGCEIYLQLGKSAYRRGDAGVSRVWWCIARNG